MSRFSIEKTKKAKKEREKKANKKPEIQFVDHIDAPVFVRKENGYQPYIAVTIKRDMFKEDEEGLVEPAGLMRKLHMYIDIDYFPEELKALMRSYMHGEPIGDAEDEELQAKMVEAGKNK